MPQARVSHFFFIAPLVVSFFASVPLRAQSNVEAIEAALASVTPHDRVVQSVEDSQRVSLDGNTLPQALPAYETGSVDGGKRFDRMILVLKPDPTQKAALDALTAAQQNPASPLFHQWLTPETYAEHFGASSADIEQIQSWLQRNGFQVEEIATSRQALVFSGTAAQVEAAFQTSIRTYRIGGQNHIANASDPMVPAALAPIVAGVASLHDVFSAPQHTTPVKAKAANSITPEYTSGGAHYLSPADYATIYDISSLYNQAYDGSGQTIAIVGRTDISLPDVRSFRSTFGLPAKDPVSIQNGSTDPGSSVTNDVDEAMLDTEWSGAVARNATVDFVTSASTATSDGVFLSAQYIVDHNLAPVMSVSYGLCEADLGSSANSFLNSLWEQAAAEGITVLVSAGDSGAAGCDSSSVTKATHGRGVNGICSTPYSTCVGGTEFSDTANPTLYWSNTSGTNGESALSYIPEKVWNESGSTGLWSTGGGVSTVYSKPSWQTGKGVPADGKRDVPDVALTAAGHDAYLVGVWGALYGISGTSAASPSFAGIMALVAQKAEARLGNANPEPHHLATAQSSGGVAVFHDITTGNNSVLGVTGFTAAAGYDQTTGLGSVDAEKLVTAWGVVPIQTPALALTLSSSSMTLTKTGGTTTLTTAASGGLSSLVSLSVSGLPSGLTATFKPASVASPGSGSSVLTLTPGTTLAPGSWTLTVTAAAGTVTKTASLAVSLPGVGTTLTPASTSLDRGSTLQIKLATSAEGGFNSAVSLAASGLPFGVTAAFSSTKLAAPGSGSSTLTLTASNTAALGAAKLQVTVTGTGFSSVVTMPFTVVAASSTASGSTGSSTVVAAPATAGIPLDRYTTITALGQKVPVYTAITQATDVNLPGTLGLAKFASFDFSGTIPVVITITGPDHPITSAIVKTIIGGVAQSYVPTFTASTVSFTVTQAAQYYACVNNDWANSIHVFANPIVNAPSPTGTGVQVVRPGSYSSIALTGSNSVLYFGPGIYTLTAHTPITLTANQQLYLADGAFLFFGHNMTASNSGINIIGNNARVFGRGVIDGSQIPGNGYVTQFSIRSGICTIYAKNQYLAGDTGTLVYMGNAPLNNVSYKVLSTGLTANTFQFAISLGNQPLQATTGSTASTAFNMLKGAAAGWTLDGLIFRDAPNFNVWAHNTSAPTINNYKVFGWRLNSDGIDIDSADAATLTNSYLRTYDDLVAVKSTGTIPITSLTVSNLMLFRQRARGIIFSDAGLPISGAIVNGIYVIEDKTAAQINPLFAVNPTTAGVSISNITFENIMVDRALSLISLKTPLAASISGITFQNLTSALPVQTPSIYLDGFSVANQVTNTMFENVTVNGAPLTPANIGQNAYASVTNVLSQ